MVQQRLEGLVTGSVDWFGVEVSGDSVFDNLWSAVAFESLFVTIGDLEAVSKSAFNGSGYEFPELVGVTVGCSLSKFVVECFELQIHLFLDLGLEPSGDVLQVLFVVVIMVLVRWFRVARNVVVCIVAVV